MTTPTFAPPVPPSVGTKRKPEIKLFEAEFGDGYTQATPAGLNHMRAALALTWSTLTDAQAAQILAFLTDRKGVEHFAWTPPTETQALKWTCKEWETTYLAAGLQSLTATFKQSFNP